MEPERGDDTYLERERRNGSGTAILFLVRKRPIIGLAFWAQ